MAPLRSDKTWNLHRVLACGDSWGTFLGPHIALLAHSLARTVGLTAWWAGVSVRVGYFHIADRRNLLIFVLVNTWKIHL